MLRSTGLPGLGLLLVACAAPPVSTPAPPAPAVVLEAPTLTQPVSPEIAFTPGLAHEGLELEYVLLDGDGRPLQILTLRVGGIFERGVRLEPGRPVVRRVVRPEDQIKVVGRPRPRSPLAPPEVDLALAQAARLRHAFTCHQEQREWQPGQPLPPEVDQVPEPGTVFRRQVCGPRAARDPMLERTFHFRRSVDPARAQLVLRAAYNEAFPRGLSFRIVLLDAQRQAVAPTGCTLVLKQSPVLKGTRAEYRLEILGAAAVERARRVRAVRATDLVPDSGGVADATVQSICR